MNAIAIRSFVVATAVTCCVAATITPPAHADRARDDGGQATPAPVITDVEIAHRKVQMSQDRADVAGAVASARGPAGSCAFVTVSR